ncbi:MAG: hypothetical protein KGN34_04830 [Sphingomonadales bacterium]|nr:hypothetical protein [Sphingomonadales bacterium]
MADASIPDVPLPAAPRRVVLACNPHAGGYSARKLDALRAALERAGHVVRVEDSLAYRLPAAVDAAHLTCMVGGDGTARMVIARNRETAQATAYCIFPAGTVNLLAREAGYRAQGGALVRRLREGRQRRHFFGELDGQPFLCCASVGIDSIVVDRVTAGAKRRFGKLAYVLALAALAAPAADGDGGWQGICGRGGVRVQGAVLCRTVGAGPPGRPAVRPVPGAGAAARAAAGHCPAIAERDAGRTVRRARMAPHGRAGADDRGGRAAAGAGRWRCGGDHARGAACGVGAAALRVKTGCRAGGLSRGAILRQGRAHRGRAGRYGGTAQSRQAGSTRKTENGQPGVAGFRKHATAIDE